jgi:hypothetical protein
MISTLSKFIFGDRVKNRTFPVSDPAEFLYSSINWKISVIGGSYALKQFTGDDGWIPNDVDIIMDCQTEKEFDEESEKFAKSANLDLVKYCKRKPRSDNIIIFDKNGNLIDEKTPEDFKESGMDHEMFHDFIKGSRTYTSETLEKIQTVHFKTDEGRSLQSVLSETTDSPSCVNFHVETYKTRTMAGYPNGPLTSQKIFHVPQKGLELLLTGKGKSDDICSSRKEKYEERGYKYEN